MKYQTSTLLLLVILALSLFFRTYNISRNLHFTGDEGRDAIVALNIVEGKNFPILGPSLSIGDLSLGPLYYYLISPFALIDKTNPVYLAIPVIAFSVMTSALLYLAVKEIIKSKETAILAALGYAISPWTVAYGRFSWNPNIMPFFSLLYLYALWKTKEKGTWFIVAAFSFGVMVQSHYVSLIVLPATAIYFWKRRKIVRGNYKYIAMGCLLVAAMLSPLIVYDLSRNFKNLRGLFGVFVSKDAAGVQAHYFELFWPFMSAFFAYLLVRIVKIQKIAGSLLLSVVVFLLLSSTVKNIVSVTEPSLAGIKDVVSLVKRESGGEDFNFAVLSTVNREDSYRYFLNQEKLPANFDTATNQLFVVCEGQIECVAQGHPKYEIAIFDVKFNGQVEISKEWNLRGYYNVVRLIPKE